MPPLSAENATNCGLNAASNGPNATALRFWHARKGLVESLYDCIDEPSLISFRVHVELSPRGRALTMKFAIIALAFALASAQNAPYRIGDWFVMVISLNKYSK